jgi:hypothetical protein
MTRLTHVSAMPIAAALAVTLTLPAVSLAAPLCITNNLIPGHLVIPKARIKKAAVNPVVGYFSPATTISPVYGAVAVDSSGTRFGFSLELGSSVVGAVSANAGPNDAATLSFAFTQADGKLDPGDAGGGYFNGAFAVFSFIDCDLATPIP